MTIVRWLLIMTPLGVFALSFLIALRTGTSWASALGVYLLLRVGITLLCAALLYPISVFLGRTSARAFARAVLPAQVVAVSTRSSMAALPALVAGAREHLGFTAAATDFVLPLSVSLFRIGTVMANPIKLLFLAQLYGVALRPEIIAMFIATEVVFSLSAAGIPNSGGAGSGFRMIPVFVAAGIPVEGVVMLDAVETIPDIFETLTNVTGQMSMATLLTRGHARLSAVPQPLSAPAEVAL
jgi:Na+/H+-dicarboxylate symporter